MKNQEKSNTRNNVSIEAPSLSISSRDQRSDSELVRGKAKFGWKAIALFGIKRPTVHISPLPGPSASPCLRMYPNILSP